MADAKFRLEYLKITVDETGETFYELYDKYLINDERIRRAISNSPAINKYSRDSLLYIEYAYIFLSGRKKEFLSLVGNASNVSLYSPQIVWKAKIFKHFTGKQVFEYIGAENP